MYFKRVMKKFHDDDYAKCDCILEICARFLKTVVEAERIEG